MFKKPIRKKQTIIEIIVMVILAIVLVVGMSKDKKETVNSKKEITSVSEVEKTTTETVVVEGQKEEVILKEINSDLVITNIGSYSGHYVEDGSDEEVSDVLMIQLKNCSDEPVEYAVLNIVLEDTVAEFTVSALMPGAEVILLEKNRMSFDPSVDYVGQQIDCLSFAKYQYPLELQEDKLSIQVLDGAVNVTNISDMDIPGDVTIYYKNKENGIYLGGIAYRITIEGGISKGEIRQKMAGHILENGSEILFVTISE